LLKYQIYIEKQLAYICRSKWWSVGCLLSVLTLNCWKGSSSKNVLESRLFGRSVFYTHFLVHFRFDFAVLPQNRLYSTTKTFPAFKLSNIAKLSVEKKQYFSHASEGHHISHDALL
jgi:hypothetical protein